ncbi:MAG: family 10 glycosylhydrolase [Bacteroidota bacterium]|nr:family 10 glycosylhydrolase [Candidatus Kapabacteria bacterium]MDW8219332.1 family 10 glycosylhydrolase [Bacteroidota bacterium]
MSNIICVAGMIAVHSCLCAQTITTQATAHQIPHVRGVWLTNVDSDALYSREKIRAAVQTCAELGFNTIFVVVWNRAMTTYPSDVMQRLTGVRIDPVLTREDKQRDPLRELLAEAKPRGIKVIAWFEFGFSCSYDQPDGGVIIRAKPHWAARDVHGKIVSKNKFQWMNAFHPEVQDFIMALLKEVVQQYDVDGIQGDDRLPALPSEAGYDDYTRNLYKSEHGTFPPPYAKDYEWVRWRAEKLSAYMQRIYIELKALKPSLLISMSPSIYPWSVEEYLQDWVTWVREGWVDIVCPQVYRYSIDAYKRELDKIVTQQIHPKDHHKCAPGILLKVGSYVASEQLLRMMIDHNRSRGLNSEVYFFFEGVKKYPELFKELNGVRK